MKLLLSGLFAFFYLSCLIAQNEEISNNQFYYHIFVESPETGDISREKLKGQAALEFDVAAFLEEQDPKTNIRIIGRKTTNKEYITFTFDSKKFESDLENSSFCQKIDTLQRIPFLGVSVNPMDDFSGVEVERLLEESPLSESGIEAGAVITSVEFSEISNPCDLIETVSDQEVDGIVDVNYNQNGESFYTSVKLGYRVKKKVTWVPCIQREEPLQDFSISKNKLSLSVFPNPTTDFTYIEFKTKNHSAAFLRLTDLSGRIIQEKTIQPANGIWSEYLDFNNYGPGVYMIQLEQNDEVVNERIVVLKK